MPEYLSPGVYAEETSSHDRSIAGVATDTAIFIGETEKGPVEPHLVESYHAYQHTFGGVFDDMKYMPYVVESFFDNGGRRCFIVRVIPERRGAPSVADFEGEVDDQGNATGLAALLSPEFNEAALINAPAASIDVVEAVISHCEENRYRFAVIDCPMEESDPVHLDPRTAIQTSYAAFYCPWLKIKEKRSHTLKSIPPGGAICGAYARNDLARGVHKAPANQIVKKVIDVVQDDSTESNTVLSRRGVNIIRDFGQRGIRVWGARTLSTNPELQYVNVRRYLIYLERSIQKGTHWAVFEPNAEPLWAKIRETISGFLHSEWRSGALLGMTPEEAYFVRCDRRTMTRNDLDERRLVYFIGVAPLKPTEFVIVRFDQLLADTHEGNPITR